MIIFYIVNDSNLVMCFDSRKI